MEKYFKQKPKNYMELILQVCVKKLIMINSVNGLRATKIVNLPMRNFL